MEYRKAIREDIDQLLAHRMAFVTLIREIEGIERFKVDTKAYLEAHLDQEDLVVWIAVEEGKIVSSCMACIYQTIPLPSCPSGKMAELLNVYTVEAYRGRGCAKHVVSLVIEELKKNQVGKIVLTHTRMGKPLYQKLGFTPRESQMQLKL